MTGAGRIFLSAGEASGDRLGAGLARALRERRPGIDLVGMGGPLMREAGVRLVQDAADVAVVGIFEVIARFPAIRRAMTRLERAIGRESPDLLVPIDFPDFNLNLAGRARKAGVEVVYFVSPQIWAWRSGRVKKIRRLVRRMLVLFPFEQAFYEEAAVPVTFVGHPVVEDLDRPRPEATLREDAGLDPERPTVALMPGSRAGEVRRLLPPMVAAAGQIRSARPDVQFLLPLAPGLAVEPILREIQRHRLPDLHTHRGSFPEILSVCDAGVVASGTASLEAALEGLPLVVVYRIHPLTYALGRALVRLEDVALPNLVAGRRVVPELIQGDCTPTKIAGEVLAYLDDPERVQTVKRGLDEIRSRLGTVGAYGRTADAVLGELDAVRRAKGAPGR